MLYKRLEHWKSEDFWRIFGGFLEDFGSNSESGEKIVVFWTIATYTC